MRCRKSIQRRNPSFAYGFTAAMCFTLAFLCLLCGLVLDGFRDTVETQLAVKRECVPSRLALRAATQGPV